MSELKSTLLARAPSNIALIKYMGKRDATFNIPENASLSMTLDSLCTFAEATKTPSGSGYSRWFPEAPRGVNGMVPELSDSGVAKVLNHMERVRKAAIEIFPRFGIELDRDPFDLAMRTANTFPESSGIASSASAFAAITVATAASCARDPRYFEKALNREPALRRALARIARLGSGSSCRSLEGPWVLWEGENANAIETRMPEMAHFVLLISTTPKKIASTQAHALVKTSPLWLGRKARVEDRLRRLRMALADGEVKAVAKISWGESWEMHSLFHTSAEPFTYWDPGTVTALQWLTPFVAGPNPPIVTMDAGPNIHVIVEAQHAGLWHDRLVQKFGTGMVLADQPGFGARVIRTS